MKSPLNPGVERSLKVNPVNPAKTNARVWTVKTTVDSVGRRYTCIPDISECPRWIFSHVYLIAFDMKLC